jgi:hypothetical protein
MLSKCANPTCSTTFRYLREGRLFVIAPRETAAGREPGHTSKSGQPEYAWLCSSCCGYFTVQIDGNLGMRAVRKCEVQDGPEFGTAAAIENNIET